MKRLSKLVSSALLIALPALSHSSDLVSLYKQAEVYDADIAAAAAAYEAEQAGVDQATAGLLPILSASASSTFTNFNSELATDDDYKLNSVGVTLTQPVFHAENWYSLSAAEKNSKRAEADYLAAQQDLILETATTYFNILRAKESLATARAAEKAFERQWEQAKERFEVGLIAITEVHEAKASYDASKTQRIEAQGQLTVAYEDMVRLTGTQVGDLNNLAADYPIKLDDSKTVEDWVKAAYAGNLSIQSAEFSLKSAQEQLKQSRSGHLPTVDLSASYTNSNYRNFNPSNNETENSSLTLSLSVPIYSGGLTQANVRRSRALVEQASHIAESTKRQVSLQARTLYINLKTNIETVASNQQNIVSRQSALEATREGYKVGTRNIVEVLDAERNYFNAQLNYAISRFDFVENSLKIKQVAGTLGLQDLQALNQWLK